MMNDVAERIRLLRERLGMTQPELGRMAGVSKQAVSQWEQGASRPDRDALLRLMRRCGVNPDWVMIGKEPMFLTGDFHRTEIEAALESLRQRIAAVNNQVIRNIVIGLIQEYLRSPSRQAGEDQLRFITGFLRNGNYPGSDDDGRGRQ